MNPDTNRLESLVAALNAEVKAEVLASQLDLTGNAVKLLRPNGEPVPDYWAVFQVGELVVIKNYTFKVQYVGETAILFEPVGPVLVGEKP